METVFSLDMGSKRMKWAMLDPSGNPVMLPNQLGELTTPSVVYFGEDGKPIVGHEAEHMGLLYPRLCIRDAKRKLGTDETLYQGNGKAYKAEDIVQILLEYVLDEIEAKVGDRPRKMVVSVPANFTDDKKSKLLLAAERAGVEIIVLPHEPTAAIFGCGAHKRGDGKVIILDIGGSTTDVTLATVSGNVTEIDNTKGLAKFGGIEFHQRLEQMALDQFEKQFGERPTATSDPLFMQDLYERVEQAIAALSTQKQTSIVVSSGSNVLQFKITRDQWEAAMADPVNQIMDLVEEVLMESGVKPEDIREFVLVGGPSRAPMFAKSIEARFGRTPWAQSEPDFAVPLGNVILGRLELERQGHTVGVGGRKLPPLDIASREVTAHPIGVLVQDDDGRLVNSVILPKSAPIPSNQLMKFKLANPGQVDASIRVLQGPDGVPVDQCVIMGDFEMRGLTPIHDRSHPIEITLKLDRNAMLSAEAYCPISGVKADLQIDYRKTNGNGHQ